MKIVVFLVLSFFSHYSVSSNLNVLTEIFPNHQYLNKQGVLVGPSVEIVKSVFAKTKIPFNLTIQPWHVAYNALQRESDTCFFSLARNNEREDMFEWVFPVGHFSSSFYALKSRNIKLSVLEDALKYRTAVIRDNYSHQYLMEQGFNEDTQLVLISSFKKVSDILESRSNQLDLVVLGDSQIKSASKKSKLIGELEQVLPIKHGNNNLYFVCNKAVSTEVTDELRAAFNTLN